MFGRVVPYKRVDLAVAACARLGRPLKVAGDGRACPRSGPLRPDMTEVEFLGRVGDAERDALLCGARALLFPGEEDFGIVPVEAQAAGVPVIAYGVGGAGDGASMGARECCSTSRARSGSPRRSSASRVCGSIHTMLVRTRSGSAASAFAGRWRR